MFCNHDLNATDRSKIAVSDLCIPQIGDISTTLIQRCADVVDVDTAM